MLVSPAAEQNIKYLDKVFHSFLSLCYQSYSTHPCISFNQAFCLTREPEFDFNENGHRVQEKYYQAKLTEPQIKITFIDELKIPRVYQYKNRKHI